MNQNPIVQLSEVIQKKQSACLATVIEIKGSSPAKVGSQIVLLADGSTFGTVGGGKLEEVILADAQTVLREEKPRITHYRLVEEGPDAIGSVCGGEVRAFLQPFLPPPQLIIVGGGHIGRPLKVMGEEAGFEVSVVDVEIGRASVPELEAVPMTKDSSVVLITTDHISDEAALRYSLTTPAQYIGMIGSRRKCRMIVSHLRADGCTEDNLARVYAPIGLDLGGPSPEEIAVAILAEVIAVRRGAKISNRQR
jgi:xanthine dehydrogenase accessory factor